MSQERINPDNYLAVLDRVDILSMRIFNKILPGSKERRKYYLAIVVLASYVFGYYLSSQAANELEFFWINLYTCLGVVFAISFLLFAENWIGDNIRHTFGYIQDHFTIEDSVLEKHIKRIYSPLRWITGLFVGLILGLLGTFYVMSYPLGGHQSSLIKIGAVGLLVVFGFIFGEAGLGSLLTVITQYLLLKDLSVNLNIVSVTHHDGLKKVGEWGIQIALLLAIVSSVGFLSVLTNPYLSTLELVLPLDLLVISNADVLAIIYGTMGLVILLILVLTIIPISAISANISAKKEEDLRKISANYETVHEKMIKNMDNQSAEEVQQQAQIISSLDVMEKKVQKVSSIPYKVKTLRRVLEAVLIPAITYLSQNRGLIEQFFT